MYQRPRVDSDHDSLDPNQSQMPFLAFASQPDRDSHPQADLSSLRSYVTSWNVSIICVTSAARCTHRCSHMPAWGEAAWQASQAACSGKAVP